MTIQDTKLLYFINHLETKVKGVILIDEETFILEDDIRPHCFKIHHPHRRVFYLCARDASERNLWINALCTAKGELLQQRSLDMLVLPRSRATTLEFDVEIDRLSQIIDVSDITDGRSRSRRETALIVAARPKSDWVSSSSTGSSSIIDSPDRSRRRSYMRQAPLPMPVINTGGWIMGSPPLNVKSSPIASATVPNAPSQDVVLCCDVTFFVATELGHTFKTRGLVPRFTMRKGQFSSLTEDERSLLVHQGWQVVMLDISTTRSERILNPIMKDVKYIFQFRDAAHVENLLPETEFLIQICGTYNIQHLVTCSTIGCESWHRSVEALLMKSSIQFTIIRANSLMQDFLIDAIRNSGAFSLPLMSSTAVSWIDAFDLAEVVTTVLGKASAFGKLYILTGPAALTCPQIAEILSEVAKKPVEFNEIEMVAAQADLQKHAPLWLAQSLMFLFNAHNAGWTAAVSNEISDLLHREATSFASFCQRHVKIFREDFLNYWELDAGDYQALYNQFDMMRRSRIKEGSGHVTHDDTLDKLTFLKCLSLILGDGDIPVAIFDTFKKKKKDRISFKEYALGMGKLVKGGGSTVKLNPS
eukprot:TRINITY_DN333_c2_g1_i8.p2 TRINITY_DN333_c2_g1~~TRINITY_DN333_c2_g1_i8.p2  ORF type:complete len:588 (-),score=149.99 TRINITY_DN333_c2_g1_i8:479-2242(-)